MTTPAPIARAAPKILTGLTIVYVLCVQVDSLTSSWKYLLYYLILQVIDSSPALGKLLDSNVGSNAEFVSVLSWQDGWPRCLFRRVLWGGDVHEARLLSFFVVRT